MSYQPALKHFRRLSDLPALAKGQKLTPAQSFALYTTAFEALNNWPDGFYDLLSNFSKPGSGSTLHSHFGFLYSQWLQYRWKWAEFQFIQDTFDQYVIRHYTD